MSANFTESYGFNRRGGFSARGRARPVFTKSDGSASPNTYDHQNRNMPGQCSSYFNNKDEQSTRSSQPEYKRKMIPFSSRGQADFTKNNGSQSYDSFGARSTNFSQHGGRQSNFNESYNPANSTAHGSRSSARVNGFSARLSTNVNDEDKTTLRSSGFRSRGSMRGYSFVQHSPPNFSDDSDENVRGESGFENDRVQNSKNFAKNDFDSTRRGFNSQSAGKSFKMSNLQDKMFDEERPVHPVFIPTTRNVDQIFEEDAATINIGEELYRHDGLVEVKGVEHPQIYEDWADAKFVPQILKNIIRSNYPKPRNFQQYAIPLIMEGYDIKGQAETGSGKSAAFLLPIIHMLCKNFEERGNNTSLVPRVYALIIEPTRELAKQLYEQAVKFADKTNVTVNFAYGEYNVGVNKRSLATKGCDILIGTPGRLKHLLSDRAIQINTLQFLVLDEADRLLDQNFMNDILEMTQISDFPDVSMRQTLFFSATFSDQIVHLASNLCKNDSVSIKNTNTDINTRIKQEILYVPVSNRKEYLLNYLKQEAENNGGVLPKKLIFVETKRDADFVATMLSDEGIKAQTVNGDRTQELREQATDGFRSGKFVVLVVTNVFARGMDFTDLGHVINMYLPTDRDTYVHRIGRTGRLHQGYATSFFDPDYQPDCFMASIIIQELEKVGQVVPDFVRSVVDPSIQFKATDSDDDNQVQDDWDDNVSNGKANK